MFCRQVGQGRLSGWQDSIPWCQRRLRCYANHLHGVGTLACPDRKRLECLKITRNSVNIDTKFHCGWLCSIWKDFSQLKVKKKMCVMNIKLLRTAKTKSRHHNTGILSYVLSTIYLIYCWPLVIKRHGINKLTSQEVTKRRHLGAGKGVRKKGVGGGWRGLEVTFPSAHRQNVRNL